MKRKLFAGMLVVVFLFSMTLAGCSKGGDGGDEDKITVDSELSMAPEVEAYLQNIDTDYAYGIAETLSYDEKYQDNQLGWRTAGSDAEHAAADYLVGEMEALELEEVEKSPAKVDKFQFNSSSLTVEGTEIDLMPASYQASGTDEAGITAEIVDCGTGFEADYEGKDVAGKIVLVGVNQADESWISGYILQAHEKGAAALVTYSVGGYGEANDDTVNVQDICSDDLLPTVAISANEAKEIQAALKDKNNMATLKVDAVLEKGGGTTYNVIGKIKGKSSDQQIIVSAHYDKYWYGFQDDSAAIGVVLAMAKAMKDSEYVPENDIVFVCHGAEEWGASNTPFDWTTGAWRNITEVNPDWAGKTIAMFNFELPAFDDGSEKLTVANVPEFRYFTEGFVNDSGLVYPTGKVASVEAKSINTDTMEDGVSYRWAGVPYFVNSFQAEEFMKDKYHTSEDNKDTWDEEVIRSNLNLYGAMAIYVDKMPALELNFLGICDDMEEAFNEDSAAAAGADAEGYKAALEELRAGAEANNAKIADINERYEKAVAEEASEEEIQKIRDEGKALNKKNLAAFLFVQQNFMYCDDWGVNIRHAGIDKNIAALNGTIEGLKNKELYAEDEESGALDNAYNLNGVVDYNYYIFSESAAKAALTKYDPEILPKELSFWATDRLIPVVYVGDTTYQLVQHANAGTEDQIDYDGAIAAYQTALDHCNVDLKAAIAGEIDSMKELVKLL